MFGLIGKKKPQIFIGKKFYDILSFLQKGSSHILAHADATNIIAQSLRCENNKVKISILELFGAMCMIPGGHKKILQAFIHFQNYSGERTRFQVC